MRYGAQDLLLALALLIVAGLCEIGGAWLIWKWRKEGWQWPFMLLGSILLVVYGIIPTLQRHIFSRIYAAYGGFFIVLALLWGWIAEKTRPDLWDVIGAAIALVAACIIMFALRRN